MSQPTSIAPFRLSIPDATLADLQLRLELTRWPDKETVSDWSQGAPLAFVQDLCAHWHSPAYSWRRCEAYLNSLPQFTTSFDDVDIYFIHLRSARSDARPLLITHGWPGSVLEFRHVMHSLAEPENADTPAFHLVVPALPGHGPSGKPTSTGWNYVRTAEAWAELMTRLGYADSETGWLAQGGDWGADVTAALGHQAPKGLRGVHMNSIFLDAKKELQTPCKRDITGEARARDLAEAWERNGNAYFLQQRTKPQSLGYSLADSPAGLAGWMLEKYREWCWRPAGDDIWDIFSKDNVLDMISMYWLTNSGTSSVRYYWENHDDSTAWKIDLPVGVSWFPGDPSYGPREWAERYYSDIVHWHELPKGGHFAAWEVPDLFVREIREWARKVM